MNRRHTTLAVVAAAVFGVTACDPTEVVDTENFELRADRRLVVVDSVEVEYNPATRALILDFRLTIQNLRTANLFYRPSHCGLVVIRAAHGHGGSMVGDHVVWSPVCTLPALNPPAVPIEIRPGALATFEYRITAVLGRGSAEAWRKAESGQYRIRTALGYRKRSLSADEQTSAAFYLALE